MTAVTDTIRNGVDTEKMFATLDLIKRMMELAQVQSPVDIPQLIAQAQDPLQIVYLFASMMNLSTESEQALLEAPTRVDALRLLHGYLTHEVQVLELRDKIATEAQTEMSREQRDYILRQQMRAIQEELGEKSPEKSEIEELSKRLAEADLPDEPRKEAERELRRLERIPAAAPDFPSPTTRIRSSRYLRTNASTFGLAGLRNSIDPRPNAWNRFRSAISRFIHHSRELGLLCWASTFTAS